MTYVKMRGTNIVAPYKMIFYVVILLYVERKGSLLGHKLVKPGHYLENSLICMIFSIRSFDCMVCRSFHTLSRYDFRSNVIRPILVYLVVKRVLFFQYFTSENNYSLIIVFLIMYRVLSALMRLNTGFTKQFL